ncbi:IclR family transcriptional regulator [Streptomyces profundus]|uniref:IclR family transcriptional regulator n=1 Tax=Streptomyces profundus TaxID=2867410 RepID=UPI001D1614A2|nr:IclR family transcriptional regulator [Streptomyces sp. MA3_2.13]UED83216.1 IclR family transcriptional regulator [Streptomyces sp. MA3_2.13]
MAVEEDRSEPAGGTPGGAVKSPIQTIDRVTALLECLAGAGPAGIGLSQVTDAVGLRASTGRTLLSALVMHGLVAQIESTRRYVLGPRFFELNRTYTLQNDLGAVAAPVLRDLWETSRETVQLATLQHGRRVDVSVLVGPQLLNVNPTTMRSAPEPVGPLIHTAAGKVLLAGLPDVERDRLLSSGHAEFDRARVLSELAAVARDGFATNHDEEVAGVCGIAAPVRDHNGRVVAALCLGYPSARRTPEHESRLREATIASAAELSRLVGAPTGTDRGEAPGA